MTSVKQYRNLIGTFEIIVGSFLILPIIIIVTASPFFGFMGSFMLISKTMGWYILNSNNYSTDPTPAGSLLLGFFFIGLVILVNGIWKIRSNKYLKSL